MMIARMLAVVLAIVVSVPSVVRGQGAGIEWDTLNNEVGNLYRAGKYDRAVVLAKKALEVAEENVNPDHPDVGTSLENLAKLYRATKRIREAEKLEEQAARIRAIKR